MCSCIKRNIANDIYLALCFTVLFTAFSIQSHIQKILTISIQSENPSYYADGYVCFGVIYLFLAMTTWISPSVILLVGPKISMILGGLCYLSFVTFGYFEISWLTYLGCAITGSGAALLWTGQSMYIILNSEIGKIYKSVGTFLIIFNTNSLAGNLFMYYQFSGVETIDHSFRDQIALILMGFVVVAVLMLTALGPPLRDGAEKTDKNFNNALEETKKTFRICVSRNMLMCLVPYMYCGIHMTYMSVIAASTGFAKYLAEDSKKFAPLSGVFQGVGEIIGCSFSLYLSRRKFCKSGLITIAGLVNIVGYLISLVGLPSDSNYMETETLPYIELPIHYFLLANVFLGLGDNCLGVEMYNYIGTLFPNNSAPGFAIFNFVKCIATAGSFYYSNLVSLHVQLLILIVFALLTVAVYHYPIQTTLAVVQETENTKKVTATDYQIHYFLLANVFLGLGDNCLGVEMYNYIGTLFPNDSAAGFAAFGFIKSVTIAGSFYYSNLTSLHVQLLILILLALLTVAVYRYPIQTTPAVVQETENTKKLIVTEDQYYQADRPMLSTAA